MSCHMSHYTSSLYQVDTFSRTDAKEILGTAEAEGDSRDEVIYSTPGARGTPGAQDGPDRYTCT